MLSEFVKVATVGEVPDNSMIGVTAGGEEIVLVKIGDDYFALDDWCSHAGGMLHEGELHPDTFEVECPIHEGMYDVRTGGVTMLPPEEAVAAYAVRIEGNDILVGPRR